MNARDNEDLRHAILDCLVIRRSIAWPVSAIVRTVSREVSFIFKPEDAEAELEFLKGLGFVQMEQDELGSTKYWQATAKGILHVERNGGA